MPIRPLILAAVAGLLAAAAPGPGTAAGPEFRIVDEAGIPSARLAALEPVFAALGRRVYALVGATDPGPVEALLTHEVDIGYYQRGRIWLPADTDDADLRETWVHELAHHATGQDSSFLMKEGIASYAVEALWREDGEALPQGWPQYGQRLDAWVALFAARGQLPSMKTFFALPGYQGGGDGDFRSWQAYVVGGSFVGWLLREQGIAAFRNAFDRGEPRDLKALEQAWRADIARARWPAFDPADHLPAKPRYQRYVQRLAIPPSRCSASSTIRR